MFSKVKVEIFQQRFSNKRFYDHAIFENKNDRNRIYLIFLYDIRKVFVSCVPIYLRVVMECRNALFFKLSLYFRHNFSTKIATFTLNDDHSVPI